MGNQLTRLAGKLSLWAAWPVCKALEPHANGPGIINTCYVIFIGAILYMLYSIGPINVCTDFEINRYKIDEVRIYAKIAFYLIYLTLRDAKMLHHALKIGTHIDLTCTIYHIKHCTNKNNVTRISMATKYPIIKHRAFFKTLTAA